jgi:hypothetical protein
MITIEVEYLPDVAGRISAEVDDGVEFHTWEQRAELGGIVAVALVFAYPGHIQAEAPAVDDGDVREALTRGEDAEHPADEVTTTDDEDVACHKSLLIPGIALVTRSAVGL